MVFIDKADKHRKATEEAYINPEALELIYDKAIIHRIARCTGHLRSVKTMVETGRDCSEVLIQLSAVKSEIAGTSRAILKQYMKNTVDDAVTRAEPEKIKELERTLDQIMN